MNVSKTNLFNSLFNVREAAKKSYFHNEGGVVKGLPLRKKNYFWDFFLFVERVPTAIQLEVGGGTGPY